MAPRRLPPQGHCLCDRLSHVFGSSKQRRHVAPLPLIRIGKYLSVADAIRPFGDRNVKVVKGTFELKWTNRVRHGSTERATPHAHRTDFFSRFIHCDFKIIKIKSCLRLGTMKNFKNLSAVIQLLGGGVMPHIETSLLPKKKPVAR